MAEVTGLSEQDLPERNPYETLREEFRDVEAGSPKYLALSDIVAKTQAEALQANPKNTPEDNILAAATIAAVGETIRAHQDLPDGKGKEYIDAYNALFAIRSDKLIPRATNEEVTKGVSEDYRHSTVFTNIAENLEEIRMGIITGEIKQAHQQTPPSTTQQ